MPEQTWLVGGPVIVPSPVGTTPVTAPAIVLATSTPVSSESPPITLSTAPETFKLPPSTDGPGKLALAYPSNSVQLDLDRTNV